MLTLPYRFIDMDEIDRHVPGLIKEIHLRREALKTGRHDATSENSTGNLAGTVVVSHDVTELPSVSKLPVY